MGDWWSLLIVRDAFDGLRRFGEFQRSLGVAKNILASRLKSLVVHDVLTLVPASDDSPYAVYVLTEKGKALFPVIVSLRQWGEAFLFRKDEPHSVLVESRRGRPIARMVVTARDGAPLRPEETSVRKVDQPATTRSRTRKAARST